MTISKAYSKKRSWVIPLLLVLFIGPLVIAWFMVIEGDKLGSSNYGQLIQPPLDITQLPLLDTNGNTFAQTQFKDHWIMVYVEPDSCRELCQKNLYFMRQIRLATGKDMNRVERVLITFTDQPNDPQLSNLLTSVYPGTLHLLVAKKQFQQFIAPLSTSTLALQQGSFYLVDPHGNVMMYYPAEVKPSWIFKDLTRLLKVSQIG